MSKLRILSRFAKQIGLICFAVFPISVFAINIESGSESASCTNSTIETFDGHATLNAEWEANKINISWYSDGQQLDVPTAAKSCTYDSDLILPTPPTKEGYTFNGWTVRHATCGIPNLDTSVSGKRVAYVSFTGEHTLYNTEFGLTQAGSWSVEYSFGVVYGMARCSSVGGDDHNSMYPSESSSDWLKEDPVNDGGQYCWCQATGFTPTSDDYSGGPQCIVTPTSSSWVFRGGSCGENCSYICGTLIKKGVAHKVALFGAVGQ